MGIWRSGRHSGEPDDSQRCRDSNGFGGHDSRIGALDWYYFLRRAISHSKISYVAIAELA
jgi:hypothetical protein